MNSENLKYYKECLVKFELEEKDNDNKVNDRVNKIKDLLDNQGITATNQEIKDMFDTKNNLVKKKILLIKKYVNEYDTRIEEQTRIRKIKELVELELPDLEFTDNIDVALEKLLN